MQYDPTDVRYLRIVKIIKTQSRKKNGELVFNRYGVSVYEMKRVIGMDAGDGCTSL